MMGRTGEGGRARPAGRHQPRPPAAARAAPGATRGRAGGGGVGCSAGPVGGPMGRVRTGSSWRQSMRVRPATLVLFVTVASVAGGLWSAGPAAAQTPTPTVARSCAAPVAAGQATCFALHRKNGQATAAATAAAVPAGYGPADLRSAYQLPPPGEPGPPSPSATRTT